MVTAILLPCYILLYPWWLLHCSQSLVDDCPCYSEWLRHHCTVYWLLTCGSPGWRVVNGACSWGYPTPPWLPPLHPAPLVCQPSGESQICSQSYRSLHHCWYHCCHVINGAYIMIIRWEGHLNKWLNVFTFLPCLHGIIIEDYIPMVV